MHIAFFAAVVRCPYVRPFVSKWLLLPFSSPGRPIILETNDNSQWRSDGGPLFISWSLWPYCCHFTSLFHTSNHPVLMKCLIVLELNMFHRFLVILLAHLFCHHSLIVKDLMIDSDILVYFVRCTHRLTGCITCCPVLECVTICVTVDIIFSYQRIALLCTKSPLSCMHCITLSDCVFHVLSFWFYMLAISFSFIIFIISYLHVHWYLYCMCVCHILK